MFKQKLTIKNSRNLKLAAILEGEEKKAPTVVMCHGFHSSKDNSLSTKALAQKLVERGISVLRFDFTGHGHSEGDIDKITPLDGLDDLKSAIRSLGKEKVALYGSSFGGYVSLLYACQNPVLALALKAPVADWAHVQISQNRGIKFHQDTKDIDIYKQAFNIRAPTLIIHGDQDDVVPIGQSLKLLKALRCDKKLQIIKGASHDIRGEDLERTNTLIGGFFQEKLL